MESGQLLLRVTWLGTYVQTQHDDHDTVVGQGPIDIVHDQDLTITEARLALDVAFTEKFAASLVVPVRVVSTSIVYRDMTGAPVDLVEPSTHHRNETLAGFADPMLLGAYTRVLANTRLTLRAGLTLPLGRTEDDPFSLGDMGRTHQHIQMGTGTVNPVVALEASRAWDKWRLGGFMFTQQVVYESSKGYQAGDRYAAGLALRRAVSAKWSVRGGPEFQAESRERWHGVSHEEEGNQGRVDVMLGAGVSWMMLPTLTVDMALKVPVYTHVVGGQLDMPAILEVGAAWTFGGVKRKAQPDEHEHGEEHAHEHGEHEHGEEHAHGEREHGEGEHDEHEHGEQAGVHGEHEHGAGEDEHGADKSGTDQHATTDKPGIGKHDSQPGTKPGKGTHAGHDHGPPPKLDTRSVDILDLGKNGERVALTPVPGKLTIFDFWAVWCEPCKTLEPALVELGRAHPDRVAIRRIEVIDWDSPVAAQHLTPGGFDLPHLKIYDAKGKLVLERSSGPGKLAALIDAVRGLVEKAAGVKTPVATKPTVKPLVLDVTVTDKGFVPRDLKVARNRPVVLRFVRKAEKTCATEVVFDYEGKRIVKDLPLGKLVELPLTFTTPGTVEYGCAMKQMISGTITVQ